MNRPPTNVVILGSTGSIGRNAVEIVEGYGDRLRVVGLSAHSNFAAVVQQAQRLQPKWLVASDETLARDFDWSGLPASTELLIGSDHLETSVAAGDVDLLVAAIVGSAGLRSVWSAVNAGKRVALANKEALVVAGSLIMQRATERNARILPVDSEHSAVFQALQAGRNDELDRIILTASGGPFRGMTTEQMAAVTVEQALSHPTWEMGPKITIDSATMMNKALEIIEARWLFDVDPSQIEVVVHPQSVVHSMVEFVDGSVLAQLSPPDMKLAIQYSLSYPQRWTGSSSKLDWTERLSLQFEPPDRESFPALDLGFEVAAAGGTAGVVVNAAK